MNPQSWNRYAYVLSNPLSLIDPDGLDCIWVTEDGVVNDDPDLGPQECGERNLEGNGAEYFYVPGSVDVNDVNFTPDGLLQVGYTDAGGYSTQGTYDPSTGIFSGAYGDDVFNANDYIDPSAGQNARIQVFATYLNLDVSQNGILQIYALSAVGGITVAGGAPAALVGSLRTLGELGTSLYYSPQFGLFVTDAIQGFAPGVAPATWGELAGFTANEAASHWSQFSQDIQGIYQQGSGGGSH